MKSRRFGANFWSTSVAVTIHAAVWLMLLYWVQNLFLVYQQAFVERAHQELPILASRLLELGLIASNHRVLAMLLITLGISLDLAVLYLLGLRERPVLRQLWSGAVGLMPMGIAGIASCALLYPITRTPLNETRDVVIANMATEKNERELLKGDWKLEYAQRSGQRIPSQDVAASITCTEAFHGSTFVIRLDEMIREMTIARIDIKPPKLLIMHPTYKTQASWPIHKNGPLKSLGLLYEIQDETLRMVFPSLKLPASESPLTFDTQGTDNTLLVFSRKTQ